MNQQACGVANVRSHFRGASEAIEEHFNSSDNSLDYIESFLFDLASNRVQKTRDLGRYQTIDKTVYTGTAAIPAARVSSTEFGYDLQGRLQTAKVTQYSGGSETRVETTSYDYNSSGIRVSALTETDANGNGTVDSRVLTEFLNDANNHTGYSQVLRESHYDADTDQLTKTVDYTFGHAELSQRTMETNDQGQVTNDQTLIFGHDGHGSVRVLTDLAATAVQFYAFDAYGQMLAIWNQSAQLISGGSGQYADPAAALTNLLYAGEQFDPRIGQQYLRARYYDPTTGRFNRLDPFFGNLQDPLSFHKYLYVHADPVQGVDPSGKFIVATIAFGIGYISGLRYAKAKADLSAGGIVTAFLSRLGLTYARQIALLSGLGSVYLSTFIPNHFRFTKADWEYSHDPRTRGYGGGGTAVSAYNRRLVDMAATQIGRERLAVVTQLVRSTEIFACRPNTCHKWVKLAGEEIAKLPREYWENSDYKIEQVVWNVTPVLRNIDHATLRITFADGRVAHFDNGFWGDVGIINNLPELNGSIAFDENIVDPVRSVKAGPFALDNMQDNSYF